MKGRKGKNREESSKSTRNSKGTATERRIEKRAVGKAERKKHALSEPIWVELICEMIVCYNVVLSVVDKYSREDNPRVTRTYVNRSN